MRLFIWSLPIYLFVNIETHVGAPSHDHTEEPYGICWLAYCMSNVHSTPNPPFYGGRERDIKIAEGLECCCLNRSYN